MTQDSAMPMIAALVALAVLVGLGALFGLAAPGLAFAAEPNLKASFACELVDDGHRIKLPAKNVRLEAPVECKLAVAGAARPEPFAARIVTTWTDIDKAGKKLPKKSEHTGKVNGGAPWTATLAPDKDFVGCIDVVIEAALIAPGADPKPAWSQRMNVKQFCPD
jgi:hypothetical protein